MEFVLIAIFTLLLISAAGVIIFLTRKQHSQTSTDSAQSALLMQQHLESLRSDVRNSIQHLTENVNQQLSLVNQQIQSQTNTVGNRLDNAARVISDVQKNIGELATATQEIKELGQGVSKLEELLRAPKLRGGLGEFLLEDLLKQVLPSQHYEMQYHFRNGSVVDAIIRTSDRMVPIDSKFPLENFRKMLSTSNETEKKGYQKAFYSDVKKHIDAIATKYILPDEGTFPFALMYIPAENIYYEVMIKDESANGAGVYSYGISRKVIPVSPNSFYAYLQVISLGLRGLYIEQKAREILDVLSHLQGDVGRIRECFDTLGTHLDNARKKYEETDKRFSNFEGRLDHINEHKLADSQTRQIQSEQLLN
ncbi:MAG TPA: DNA recombination protein RmuC [Bacteroidota bacterium]|nr:DNA recombination protein RmuC [Bacteroidota bacterium]